MKHITCSVWGRLKTCLLLMVLIWGCVCIRGSIPGIIYSGPEWQGCEAVCTLFVWQSDLGFSAWRITGLSYHLIIAYHQVCPSQSRMIYVQQWALVLGYSHWCLCPFTTRMFLIHVTVCMAREHISRCKWMQGFLPSAPSLSPLFLLSFFSF